MKTLTKKKCGKQWKLCILYNILLCQWFSKTGLGTSGFLVPPHVPYRSVTL